MPAQNLARGVQMLAAPATLRAQPKRPAAWEFHITRRNKSRCSNQVTEDREVKAPETPAGWTVTVIPTP
jgi:hypothetical protein